MQESTPNQPEALFSKNVQVNNNTYYFNVRESKNGNRYLTITETHTNKEGQRYRSSLSLFGNHIEPFHEVFKEMAEKIKI